MMNKVIYAYERYWIDEKGKEHGPKAYKGVLKIGETTRDDAEKRVKEQYNIATPCKEYNIVWVDSAQIQGTSNEFTDKKVHEILVQMGKTQFYEGELDETPTKTKSEFIECTLDDVKKAIWCLQRGNEKYCGEYENFAMRKEQENAVEKTAKYFEKNKNNKNSNRFLWDAKMRFGKCFTSYQLIKKMGWKKVLVTTFKPAVAESWEKDLMHEDFKNWQYISLKENTNIDPNNIDPNIPCICFGSLQDLLGKNGEDIKEKNKWIHNQDLVWDCVIFDEYHYGAWRENTKELFEDESNEQEEILDENELKITKKYSLYLSGTPFRARESGEFTDDQIFEWTYFDEQRTKQKFGTHQEMARVNLYTYYISEELTNEIKDNYKNQFDLNIFFKTRYNIEEDRDEFVYKNSIERWLDTICGKPQGTIGDINNGDRPRIFPFEDTNLRNILLHTLWFLPNVSACKAMYNLLKEHIFFKDNYKIVIAAGDECGCGADALEPVQRAITKYPLNTKTITLSCGKLTTGVTVKEWTGILMLRNISTPETYFQAAWRVQSPWVINRGTINEKILKTECYIFDFAPDRALEHIKNYCDKLDPKCEKSPREKLEEFMKFLPILVYNGGCKQDNIENLLDKILNQYNNKKWNDESLINNVLLINDLIIDELLKVDGEKAKKSDKKTIINKSECLEHPSNNDCNRDNENNLNNKDNLKDEDDSNEKEDKKEFEKRRKKLIENLKIITSRIPNYLSLSNKGEDSLQSFINNIDKNLFKLIIGFSFESFEEMVKNNVFNNDLLNCMIYNLHQKIKSYDNKIIDIENYKNIFY